MTSPSPASATYADLAAVPDNLVAEIIFGQLVTHAEGRVVGFSLWNPSFISARMSWSRISPAGGESDS